MPSFRGTTGQSQALEVENTKKWCRLVHFGAKEHSAFPMKHTLYPG